jgi:hypothetical protein
VALFWKAVFLIALCANAVGLILDPASFVRPGEILNRVSMLFFGLLWLFCRRGHRSWRTLLAAVAGAAKRVGPLRVHGGGYTTARRQPRACHASSSQPTIMPRPPTGVTAPSHRGAPSAIA